MVTKAFPLWWNVVDHPQVTHWRLCRAIWQQSGHHFDAIIFSILDFWSLLSFGHWRAHSPNRAIAVRQLDSLNRSFALYLPKRAAQGNEKTCKLPMLASLLQIKKHGRNSSNLVNHISFCKKKWILPTCQVIKFFPGADFSLRLQLRDFDNCYTQWPFRRFLKIWLDSKCCAIASPSFRCVGKRHSWAMTKHTKTRSNFQIIPTRSNNLESVEAKGIKIKIKTKPASEPAVRGMQAVASAWPSRPELLNPYVAGGINVGKYLKTAKAMVHDGNTRIEKNKGC